MIYFTLKADMVATVAVISDTQDLELDTQDLDMQPDIHSDRNTQSVMLPQLPIMQLMFNLIHTRIHTASLKSQSLLTDQLL